MDKKKVTIGLLVTIIIATSFIVAAMSNPVILVAIAQGVLTSEGDTLDLPIGTMIGGEPDGSYLLLGEETEVETTDGTKILGSGERIWCEGPPGYPDVCGGLG